MALDTEIRGEPGAVERAASWLRGTLKPAVDRCGDVLARSSSRAGSSWRSPAGDGFGATAREAVGKADGLTADIGSAANALDGFAAAIRAAQSDMADIRARASDAGLTVHGFDIEQPGEGPDRPGPMTVTAETPQSAIDAHEAAVSAYERHQEKVRAWNTAVARAEEVRSRLDAASEGLGDQYRGLKGAQWILTPADIAGGMAGAAMEYNATALRGAGRWLGQQAVVELDRALAANPAVVGRQRWYHDLDHARSTANAADDLVRRADDLDTRAGRFPLKLGGALAVAGIGYDIATGKDPVQATASGAGGFLASVGAGAATGAVVGSFVPIPGVGTAAGAVVGAGVGIFTSGAIDSLFENGPDVEAAAEAGWEALTDTGEAIGDAAGAVGGAIGGLFD